MQSKLSQVAMFLAASASCASAVTRVSADCLSKTESFGSGDLVSDAAAFDQTSSLANILPVDFSPFKYKLCLDDTFRLISFTWTYASENGSQTYTLPRVGPAVDTCEDFTLESRSHIDFASVSKDANGVAAIKIASSDGKTILFGNADESLESQVISFPTEERVIGNFGSSNAAGIVDLGFITKNVECTAEDVAEDEAEAAENAENTDQEGEETDEGVVDGEGEDGSGAVDDTNTEESFGSIKDVSFKSKDEEGDDDGSDVVMWVVVIVIIAIVLAVIIIIVVHCCSKNKSTSISKVGDVGAEMKTGPATANNSSSIPQESEEDGKARANKESDRQYFGNTEDV